MARTPGPQGARSIDRWGDYCSVPLTHLGTLERTIVLTLSYCLDRIAGRE